MATLCSCLTGRIQRVRLVYMVFGCALGVMIGSLLTWNVLMFDCNDCGHPVARLPIKRHMPDLKVIDIKDYITNKSNSGSKKTTDNSPSHSPSLSPSPPSSHSSKDISSLMESLFVILLPSEDSSMELISASAHTWGKLVSQLMIFVDRDSPTLSVPHNVHVNRLFKIKHLNNHPTTSELLLILEYLHSSQLNNSKWFFFTSEKVYINSFLISSFLESIPNGVEYVGSASREVSEVLLYCSKEGGILMSRSAVIKMVEGLSSCKKWGTIYSWDKGLGKCYSETTRGGQCTLGLSKFFLNDQPDTSLMDILHKDTPFNKAFSIYPITNPQRMYSLHYFYTTVEYMKHFNRAEFLNKMIMESCLELPDNVIKSSDEVQWGCHLVTADNHTLHDEEKNLVKYRRTTRFRATNHFQYRGWKYFNSQKVYTDDTTETHRHVGLYKYFSREFKRATDQVTREVNKKHQHKRLKLRSVIDAYVRNDPLFGNEYIIDALFAENRRTPHTIRERVRILQPLQTGYTVKPSKNEATETVNIIVPISGVTQRCYDYLEMFRKLVKDDMALRLVLVVFGERELADIREKVTTIISDSPKADIVLVKGRGNFSRAQALDQGMMTLDKDQLAFLCDVDMEVNKTFFDRCRKNTMKGKMVYYPEVFKMYNSRFIPPVKTDKKKISRTRGHWGNYAYGMLCIYKSDYSKVGGLNTKMMGWGGEDVDFFEKVLKGRIEILRAPDVGLVHRWHKRVCSKNTMTESNYKQCLSSRAEALGDRRQLAHYLYLLQETYPDLKQKLHIPE